MSVVIPSMSDRDGKIWMDGKMVEWRDAKIHVLTHTLHYGCGAFEGVRAYNTVNGTAIFRLEEHTERLFNSAKILRMHIPFSQQEIMDVQRDVVRANKLESCYIRPLVWIGDKGAERKTRQRQSPGRCGMPHHGQHVQQFTAAFVMAALAAAHSPEIKADCRPATLGEGARQCLHHLVVHGAAEQGMRVGNHGDTFRSGCGLVQGHFDPACLALDREFLGLCVQNQAFVKARLQRPRCGGVSKRSTT